MDVMLEALDFNRDGKQPDGGDMDARDAINVLPLSIIPLRTKGLQRACLVKNANLETAIELYRDNLSGSGQVQVADLKNIFPSYRDELKHDIPIMKKLSKLNSFDVYSLRVELRRLDIQVDEQKALVLSQKTRESLNSYMQEFTRPLIEQIYGDQDNGEIHDISDLVRKFSNPDVAVARQNLRLMSDRLDVRLHDVPDFLEDYADIFLSVAYFRKNLDTVVPQVEDFVHWVNEINSNSYLSRDRTVVDSCRAVKDVLVRVLSTLQARLKRFQRRFESFWGDITANSFYKLKNAIITNHTNISGMVCGLAVKMGMWKNRFPTEQAGPNRRAEFILQEMVPGMQKLAYLEETAPDLV